MTIEEQLRERLRKIKALFEGAATPGEKQAAAAAIGRIRQTLQKSAGAQPLPETKFSMADQWQRRTTLMLRAPSEFIHRTLWPEYLDLQAALMSYLNEATERIIREEVFPDAGEAAERTG